MSAALAVDQKFFDLMSKAHDQHQTGKLYAYAKGDGAVHVATLMFKEGSLCGCRFDAQSGIDALRSIADAVLASVMFIRTSPGQIKEQPATPPYEDVVVALRKLSAGAEAAPTPTAAPAAPAAAANDEVPGLSAEEMVYAVSVTLGDILGNQAVDKVKELGRTYPPDTQRQKFVSACLDLTATYLGQKRAAEILGEMFD